MNTFGLYYNFFLLLLKPCIILCLEVHVLNGLDNPVMVNCVPHAVPDFFSISLPYRTDTFN